MDTQPTQPSAETRAEEAREAQREHTAQTPVDPSAADAAPSEVDSGVADHEREMNERGAHQQGEGEI
jgi:hypothetical protein